MSKPDLSIICKPIPVDDLLHRPDVVRSADAGSGKTLNFNGVAAWRTGNQVREVTYQDEGKDVLVYMQATFQHKDPLSPYAWTALGRKALFRTPYVVARTAEGAIHVIDARLITKLGDTFEAAPC